MKLLLIKAKSEDEFVNVAKKNGCEIVIVQPLLKGRHFAKAALIGVSGFYEYALKMSASTKAVDRKVIFKKAIFERTADESWSEDERQKARIRIFLEGEKEVEELRRRLPAAQVTLMTLDGDTIDLQQVHSDAAKYGVSVT